jgi:hypothetical protein
LPGPVSGTCSIGSRSPWPPPFAPPPPLDSWTIGITWEHANFAFPVTLRILGLGKLSCGLRGGAHVLLETECARVVPPGAGVQGIRGADGADKPLEDRPVERLDRGIDIKNPRLVGRSSSLSCAGSEKPRKPRKASWTDRPLPLQLHIGRVGRPAWGQDGSDNLA